MKRTLVNRLAMGALVGAAAVGGYDIAGKLVTGAHAAAGMRAMPTAPAAETASAPLAAVPDFRSIVARYGPAVVNIAVAGTVKTGARTPFGNIDPDDPWLGFFQRFGPRFEAPEGDRVVRGMGSGFIVSGDGVILTNAHVVAGASEVLVKLTDKREFKAKVVGIDKDTDIAVLRIDAHGLPTVKLGDAASAQVGDWVLAIGSPFGFENSVTAGIVSAKSRSLPDESYVPFIQTDVAINPGNSGGPLMNLNGEVIGINSQIYSRSGGYQGLSFAIPVDVAIRVKDQVLTQGAVKHGRLGISVQELNQGLARSFGLDSADGALVSQVEKGSPAAKAGLEAGDVVLSLNGQKVGSASQLAAQIAALPPGTKVEIGLWRNGGQRSITATVGEQRRKEVAANTATGGDGGKLGVAVRPLSAEERNGADMPGGLMVVDVSGAAAKAGIRPGDVILALNGHRTGEIADLKRELSQVSKHAALLIQRDAARIFVPIELG